MKLLISTVPFVIYCSVTNAWNVWSWFPWFSPAGCDLKLNHDLSHIHEPLFLVKSSEGYELAMPQLENDDGVFKLKKGEKLIVACPGRRNEIRGISEGAQSMVSTCVKGKTLHVKNKNVLSSDLDCKNRVFTTLKLTDKECGDSVGEEVELGFEVNGWHKLVTSCYYRSQGETLYSKHMLYGSTIKGAENQSKRRNFLRGPKKMFPNFSPEYAYKQANQRLVLTRMLGEDKANYILSRTYLSRGHLAPDGDFLLGAWQFLTYFYVNAAPQWQSINSGNWLRLESTLRYFAMNMKADLIISTGTYGILSLEDEDGYKQELYLEPYQKLLPVPEYMWKLVVYPEKKSCIVLLMYNNPFIQNEPPSLCPNICKDHGWPVDSNNNFKGYLQCCSYEDFKKVVNYVPDEECESILGNEIL